MLFNWKKRKNVLSENLKSMKNIITTLIPFDHKKQQS